LIRKIVVMCDEHGIAWGTPQRLAGFVRALDGNKHLAMEFWSIVARMNDEDSGARLEPNQVLEVIVEGVTGRSLAEVIVSGGVERRAVSDLTRLLAGEDVWSPVTESPESSSRVEVVEDIKVRKAPAGNNVRRDENLSSDKLSNGKFSNDRDVQGIKDPKGGEELAGEAVLPSSSTNSVSEPVLPQQYQEASSAERSDDPRGPSLEPEALLPKKPVIPRYDPPTRGAAAESSRRVENIEDSKVRKAPAGSDVRRDEDLSNGKVSNDRDVRGIKDAKAREKLAGEAVLPSSPTNSVSEPVLPRWYQEKPSAERSDDHRRLFLEPEPLLQQQPPVRGYDSPRERGYDPSTRVPLAEYAETGKSRRTLIIGIFLLAMVGGMASWAFFELGYGLAYWQTVDAMIHRAWNKDAGNRVAGGENVPSSVDGSSPANSPADRSPITPSDGANGVNGVSGTVGPAPAVRGATGIPGVSGVGRATSSGVNRPGYQQGYRGGEQAGSATGPRSETVRGTQAGANSFSAEKAGSVGALVQVPAEVMESRLISSRVPVYPDAARAEHVEGRVVMQAIVTKDGAVGHLHFASGNPALRAAALEAASAWRYRPYAVNGEPVDVLTMISIDFVVEK
jgi:TonB family protein